MNKKEMHLKRTVIFFIFFLVSSITAYCGQISRIELVDGSAINGEITSYKDGIYVVDTANFGEVKVAADKVSKIESANSPEQTNNFVQPQIDAYKSKIMSNPENVAVITSLASDPQIQEVVKDTQIQDDVRTGNIQALIKNEKFMDIVNNSKMQEAVKKIKQNEQ
jgi:hypothetical protein